MTEPLTRIGIDIRSARDRGDALAEARLRVSLAREHSASSNPRQAAQELHWAAALARQDGELLLAAQALFEKGSVLMTVPSLQVSAKRALRHGGALAKMAGDRPLALESARLRIKLCVDGGQWSDAAEAALHTAELLEWMGRKEELVSAWEMRASYLHRQDQLTSSESYRQDALDALGQAIHVSEGLDDLRRNVKLRLMRRILRDFVWEEGAPVSALNTELEQQHGVSPFAAEPLGRAMEALQAGMSQTGRDRARSARDKAQDARDPLRLLLSSLLLAEALEMSGDLSGALAALLSCKDALERSEGVKAGQPLVLVLEALKGRWGETAWTHARSDYRPL